MGKLLENKLYKSLITFRDFLGSSLKEDYFNNASEKAIDAYSTFIEFVIDNFGHIEESSYRTIFSKLNTQWTPELRYVVRSTTNNIPWSLVPSLKEIIESEIGANVEILFRPQWNFNYTVFIANLKDRLRSYLRSIFVADRARIDALFGEQDIYIISFPLIEKNNVLLHSVVAHEIGHLFYEKWVMSSEAKQFIDSAEIELSKHYHDSIRSDMLTPYKRADDGIRWMKSMLREIASDIYGYALFGPSMLFALMYVETLELKPSSPTSNKDYYPPIPFRVETLFNELYLIDDKVHAVYGENEDAGAITEAGVVLSAIEATIGDLISRGTHHQSLLPLNVEVRLIQSIIPNIIADARSKIRNEYYGRSSIDKLLSKLSRYLPINEIDSQPVLIADILFAGWIRFFQLNEANQGAHYVSEYQALMRLLLKSVHSSHVQEQYNTIMDGLQE